MEARDDIAINCASFNIPGFEGNLDVYLYAEPGMDAKKVRDEYVALSYAGAKGVDLLPYKKDIGLRFPTELALVLPGNAQFDSYGYCLGLARAVHGNGSGAGRIDRLLSHMLQPCMSKREWWA